MLSSLLQSLESLGCTYAFYYQHQQHAPFFQANGERFPSASIIKIPILLAWVYAERAGMVNRADICDLDDEPQVQGAGFSWLLHIRQLPFQDVLLMMMATSDNLCTNLIIHHMGLENLQHIFKEQLGLGDSALERKLMDYAARARGLNNWITAQDCIRFFGLIQALTEQERAWVDTLFGANVDNLLFLRNIPRDTLTFYHKTGSMSGILHDWGYTKDCRIFLLTHNPREDAATEVKISQIFGALGEELLYQIAGSA